MQMFAHPLDTNLFKFKIAILTVDQRPKYVKIYPYHAIFFFTALGLQVVTLLKLAAATFLPTGGLSGQYQKLAVLYQEPQRIR